MAFHETLMQLRRARGWSQEQLAEQLNVTRQTVSKWELGSTTPELQKLIDMSTLFGISIDELVGNEGAASAPPGALPRQKPAAWHFEYQSKQRLCGLPLVHIHVGLGACRAKGILAIGNIAAGLVSIGLVSVGLLSVGLAAIGLFALACAALGGIAIGGVATGLFALGGIALGLVAIGGVATGYFAAGGVAAGMVALGDIASGAIAIGNTTSGIHCFGPDEGFAIRKALLAEYPAIGGRIADVLEFLLKTAFRE